MSQPATFTVNLWLAPAWALETRYNRLLVSSDLWRSNCAEPTGFPTGSPKWETASATQSTA